jgi:NAD(P)-dependent dehydrogenase (short-subunit alcohol dehydrogenase family)
MTLENRVILISGATGGLGRVVSKTMAGQGCKLVLVGSTIDKLESLAHSLGLNQDKWLAVAVDLKEPRSAQIVFENAISRFGKIDVFLHFVGGWIGGKSVSHVSVEDIASMLDQHFWTTFYLARAVYPHMVNNGWGRIMAVSSPSVVEKPAKGLPYTVGKSALEALLMTLAEELKGSGVTSNVIRVHAIDSRHERDVPGSTKAQTWTTPEEISEAILYLCSDYGGIVSGEQINLYGSA